MFNSLEKSRGRIVLNRGNQATVAALAEFLGVPEGDLVKKLLQGSTNLMGRGLRRTNRKARSGAFTCIPKVSRPEGSTNP